MAFLGSAPTVLMMKKPRVLIVEDDRGVRESLARALGYEGYDVETAPDGIEAMQVQPSFDPELILLDVMMPVMNGLEVCAKLRSKGVATPILMLTARGEETDRVLGLDMGADDYVTKPFSLRELMARVRALLRRTSEATATAGQISFGDVEIDFDRYEARKGGAPVALSPYFPGLDLPWHALFGAVIHGDQDSLGHLAVDFKLSSYATLYVLPSFNKF